MKVDISRAMPASEIAQDPQISRAEIVAATEEWSAVELRALVTEAGLLASKLSIRNGIAPDQTRVTRADIDCAVAPYLQSAAHPPLEATGPACFRFPRPSAREARKEGRSTSRAAQGLP